MPASENRYQRPGSEFNLALGCCRVLADPQSSSQITTLAEGVNWDKFFQLVERHRIAGLAYKALKCANASLPKTTQDRLASSAGKVVQAGLRAAWECAKFEKAFREISIPIVFVKGLTLSALAYGDPYVKMSADIDILVSTENLTEAARLLQRLGYVRRIPTSGDLLDWHRINKESVWFNPAVDMAVDLHSRLTNQPQLLQGLSGETRDVRVSGSLSLPTLPRDELFAYLCVHGASSAWFRLKWISDFYGLIANDPPREISRLFQCARDLGAGRSADQALLLADNLFGLNLSTELRSRLKSSITNRFLVSVALRELTASEPTERLLGTVQIHFSQLLLLPGLAFKLTEILRQLRTSVGRVSWNAAAEGRPN